MNAVDTNILVYAHRQEVQEHELASRTLRAYVEGPAGWALPWPCLYEFFSVVTNMSIWRDKASTQKQAWSQIQAWLGSPSLVLLAEAPGFAEILAPLANRVRVRGAKIHDARIVALCLAHGIEALITRDRDFSLFPELSLIDPFASTPIRSPGLLK